MCVCVSQVQSCCFLKNAPHPTGPHRREEAQKPEIQVSTSSCSFMTLRDILIYLPNCIMKLARFFFVCAGVEKGPGVCSLCMHKEGLLWMVPQALMQPDAILRPVVATTTTITITTTVVVVHPLVPVQRQGSLLSGCHENSLRHDNYPFSHWYILTASIMGYRVGPSFSDMDIHHCIETVHAQ